MGKTLDGYFNSFSITGIYIWEENGDKSWKGNF
jgi:hypothetical protein